MEGSCRCLHYHRRVFAVLSCGMACGYLAPVRKKVRGNTGRGNTEVILAEVILVSSCIFFVSSLCNPIIYSIRKRDFQAGVKNLLRRIGLCASFNDVESNATGMNNVSFNANLVTKGSTPKLTAVLSTQHQDGRLTPIPENQRIYEASPNDIENIATCTSNVRFSGHGTQASFPKPAAALTTRHQGGRLSPIAEVRRMDEASPSDIENIATCTSKVRFIGQETEASFPKPAAALTTRHQDGRLSPISEIQRMDEANPNGIENIATCTSNLRFSDHGINTSLLCKTSSSAHHPTSGWKIVSNFRGSTDGRSKS